MPRRAIHIIDAPYGATYNTILVNREARMLCDKPLYFEYQRRETRRETTIAIDQLPAMREARMSGTRSMKVVNGPKGGRFCRECIRLADMTPEARAKALADKETAKREALAKLRGKSDAERLLARDKMLAELAPFREDAIACLDAWRDGERQICRCPKWVVVVSLRPGGVNAHVQCNLHRGHEEPCKPQRDEPAVVTTDDVLKAAVMLYKVHHKSGGEKLIVQIPGSRTCRDCGWHGDPIVTNVRSNGRVIGTEQRCVECDSTDFAELKRTSLRHVACRFCRMILGRNVNAFAKGLEYALFDAEGKQTLITENAAINVRKHTIECALRYIAGEQETNQDDEPIAIPGHLPSESFVLEMDR